MCAGTIGAIGTIGGIGPIRAPCDTEKLMSATVETGFIGSCDIHEELFYINPVILKDLKDSMLF